MPKRSVHITLFMSELLYDIENKTHLTARSLYAGDNDRQTAMMRVTADDEDRNNILRSIGNVLGTLRTTLNEYAPYVNAAGATDELTPTTNISIILAMPSNYNPQQNDAVAAALHQYVVDSAIGDWFTMTDKADAAPYLQSASADLEKLGEALNKRMRPSRPSGGGGGDVDIDDEYYVI